MSWIVCGDMLPYGHHPPRDIEICINSVERYHMIHAWVWSVAIPNHFPACVCMHARAPCTDRAVDPFVYGGVMGDCKIEDVIAVVDIDLFLPWCV